MSTSIKFDKGWKKLHKALDPKTFGPVLERQVKKANAFNGKVMQAAIRRVIKSNVPPANRALTVAIKKSSKSLVDKGDLWGSVSSHQLSWDKVFVGIHRTHSAYNIGRFLHDGGSIPVTDRMRNMFTLLWYASNGSLDPSKLEGRAAELWERMPGGWLPLKPSTAAIVIPSRPFIKQAFADDAARKRVEANWTKAVQAAIKQSTKG